MLKINCGLEKANAPEKFNSHFVESVAEVSRNSHLSHLCVIPNPLLDGVIVKILVHF